MKLFVQFDASASSYDIKNELSMVSSWQGIRSVQLLEKVSGEGAQYCVEVDVADDQVQGLRDRLRGVQSQYSGYVYNLKETSYRPV